MDEDCEELAPDFKPQDARRHIEIDVSIL